MLLSQTEKKPTGPSIDALSPQAATDLILRGQSDAIAAVQHAGAELAAAAEAMAAAIRAGGNLIYVAAGSSGLMALADACELPGTFGISSDQIHIWMAGGVPVDGKMPGDTEDDVDAVAGIPISAHDAVITLSASGSTPYALAAARRANQAGATLIGIANNVGTPLLECADVAICLTTPPEVIAGSTRLGAGTAQKAALNAMSTLMGIRLGHVYQGMMVNLTADNAKLRTRAIGIVSEIANVSEDDAQKAIDAADGQVKTAILVASGHAVGEARSLLEAHQGQLGPCLSNSPLHSGMLRLGRNK